MGRFTVTDDQRLTIVNQQHELHRQVKSGSVDPELVSRSLQALITGLDPAELLASRGSREQPSKHNLAAERQTLFQTFYTDFNFKIEVPLYRPATTYVSYEAFMSAVGQEDHWTLMNEDERAKITFEPAEQGYWFWAEIQDSCLRTGTCWNDLTSDHTLLCLEEYAIIWHVQRILENILLDRSTWCWLRTRYQTASGLGALRAFGYDGGVDVNGDGPERLSHEYGLAGGRLAEVVN